MGEAKRNDAGGRCLSGSSACTGTEHTTWLAAQEFCEVKNLTSTCRTARRLASLTRLQGPGVREPCGRQPFAGQGAVNA